MKNKTGCNKKAIYLSLLNLNCFGIGYFLAGLKKRGGIALIGNLVLIIIAQVVNASKQPMLWAFIFLAVFIGMAIDLWLLIQKDPDLIPEKLSNKNYLLLVICAVMMLLFFGGFAAYRIAGNKIIDKGIQAYEEDDYQTSFKYLYSATQLYRLSLNPRVVEIEDWLNEVSMIVAAQSYAGQLRYEDVVDCTEKFHEFYPDSSKISFMNKLAIDNILALVQENQSSNDYQVCQDSFEMILADYPEETANRKNEIDEAMAENYLKWGTFLSESGDHKGAVETMEMVVNHYPASNSFDSAYQGAAQAHYDLAISLKTNKDYNAAFANLLEIENKYADFAAMQLVKREMPDTLIKYGVALREEDHFIDALDKFDQVAQYTTEDDFLAQAENETQETITQLARDDGMDASTLISDAKSQACSGNAVDHFAIDIFPEEAGKVLSCDGRYYGDFPSDLKADIPGTFRYVVDVEDADRRVQSCDYITSYDTRVLERWQYGVKVTIRLVKTGEIFKEKTFVGTSPESCPVEYMFSSKTELTWGEDIDGEKIGSWLETVLK